MGYMGFGLGKEEYMGKPENEKPYRKHPDKYLKLLQHKSLQQYLEEVETFKNRRGVFPKINESAFAMLLTLGAALAIYAMFLWVNG